MYKRAEYQVIMNRLKEQRKFIQVVMGARQIGKSTVVKQVLKDLDAPYQLFSADNVPTINSTWISDCWAAIRSLKKSKGWENVILVIDEIQKITKWSEVVQKFSIDMARRRASIPKLQVYNNALKMVYSPFTFEQAILDRKSWGRIFESGIGAYLVSQAFVHRFEIFYWRERDDEVDFILRKKGSIVAIEVKSNAEKRTEGLDKFRQLFKPQAAFIVGDSGISAEDFLSMDIRKLF